ncbi:helix-turn-helix domain-containing protein [Romboutsia sp. 13368]|uniref:helix-turn-helix domain-containing protein n=1 Tax=Romboutsia sp. 13368 TaxID=2708053 RepID=UPI0025EE0CC8|nr:helix-turn-helix transcriptional regulator [Romboutsia sp. 13368]
MKNITFGKLLEKLLHLSKQKKSSLAKVLGYDVSYISKWITGKNLPTQKSISDVCKITSEFIVDSLNMSHMQELKDYFEIDENLESNSVLAQYLEKSLKEAYMYTAKKSVPNLYKKTHSEDSYNSMTHINPRLRKQYLSKDANLFMSNSDKVDLIISADLYRLNNSDKMAIADMKKDLAGNTSHDIRVRLLMGFDIQDSDIVFNTIMIINMITTYPEINFEIFNCEVDCNAIISVIKDRIFHAAIYTKDKRCLFTNMSKDKHIVDEIYYSLEDILKNQAKPIIEVKSALDIIRKRTYLQYIMNQDLRWLIGHMNELFMPYDLFEEISESIFGYNEEVLDELKKINMLLQNVIYKSKLKVLIYELDIRKYISVGELNFFNIPVKLTFEQRERHINYIKKIIEEYDNVEIKLIDGDFVEAFKDTQDPSIYLSKTLKMISINPRENHNDYAIIKDSEFKNICDEFFEILWNKDSEIVISDKIDMLDRIEKTLTCTKIINESLKFE